MDDQRTVNSVSVSQMARMMKEMMEVITSGATDAEVEALKHALADSVEAQNESGESPLGNVEMSFGPAIDALYADDNDAYDFVNDRPL